MPTEIRESYADDDRGDEQLTQSVFLIGFMGAGKSSAARRLARMCGIASVDMDTYISRKARKSISDIFSEIGEEGFRLMESDALNELAESPTPLLISCGGGVILREENRIVLKERGFVVFLQVSVEEAASRIRDTSNRPLFKDLENARKLCAERTALYESCADAVIDTDGKSVAALSTEIQHLLEKEGVLCPRQES